MSSLTLDYRYTADDSRLPDVKTLAGNPMGRFYCPTPRPMVGVKLIDPRGKGVFLRALLDTGSVSTVLPALLMPELGVEPDLCTEQTHRGLDGMKFPGYRWEPGVDLELAGTWRLPIRPVWFGGQHTPGHHLEMVLGANVFEHFEDVRFDFRAGTFTLEAHDDVEVLESESALAAWLREEQAA